MPRTKPFHTTFPCPDPDRGGAYGWRFNVWVGVANLLVAGDETFADRELASAAGARAAANIPVGAAGREP